MAAGWPRRVAGSKFLSAILASCLVAEGVAATLFHVLSYSEMSPSERCLVGSLQGLAAGGDSGIWVHNPTYDLWTNEFSRNHGVSFVPLSDRCGTTNTQAAIAWLLSNYTAAFGGHIRYDFTANPSSRHIAVSIAGYHRALPADAEIAGKYGALLKPVIADTTARDNAWLCDEYLATGRLSKDGIIVLSPPDGSRLGDTPMLADLAAHKKWSVVYRDREKTPEENKAVIERFFRNLEPGSPAVTWFHPWDPKQASEDAFVRCYSEYGLGLLVCNTMRQMVPFMTVGRKASFSQGLPESLEADASKHCAAFVMNSGENYGIMMNAGEMPSERYFSARFDFPLSWDITPTFADFAPAVLAWYYRNKRPGDSFVTGFSGHLYFHPSACGEGARGRFGADLDALLARTDMRVVLVNELREVTFDDWMGTAAGMYTRLPHVAGVVLGKRYRVPMTFHNGKPVIPATHFLKGLVSGGSNAREIADSLNRAPARIDAPEGYSVIYCMWSSMKNARVSMRDVADLVSGIDPSRVRIVNLDELVRQVTTHVPHAGR